MNPRLTPREREVLQAIATAERPDDCRAKAVACKLGLSYRTVEAHLRGAFIKLNANSRHEAVQKWQSMAVALFVATASIAQDLPARLDGLAATTATKAVYSVRSPTTTNYVRNPACWLYGARGLEAVSPARDVSAPDSPGMACCVAVTKRHVYAATHNLSLHPGTRVWFVTSSNTIIERLVLALTNAGLDVSFGLLNLDLPDAIPPLRVFAGTLTHALAAGLNQDDYAQVVEITTPAYGSDWYFQAYPPSNYAEWSVVYRAGDSGKPVMALRGGELLLIGGWTFPNFGSALWRNRTNNNAALAGLSAANGAPAYQLEGGDNRPLNVRVQ